MIVHCGGHKCVNRILAGVTEIAIVFFKVEEAAIQSFAPQASPTSMKRPR